MHLPLLFAAVFVGALASSAAASAQTATGTITINGSVARKCAVTAGGTGGSFSDTVSLGELAGSDGTLLASLGSTSAASPAFTSSFTLKCTSANMGVSVTASPMRNTAGPAAPSGYTNTINIFGRAAIDLVGGGVTPLLVDDSSAAAGATTDTLGAGNFLANIANNIRVSAFGFNTSPNTSDLLVSGAYTGTIVVVLTPS